MSVKTFFDFLDVTKIIDYHSFTNHGENNVHLLEVEGVWVARSEINDGFFDLTVGDALLFKVKGLYSSSKEAIVQRSFQMWIHQILEVL
jgi:hypothetical protein